MRGNNGWNRAIYRRVNPSSTSCDLDDLYIPIEQKQLYLYDINNRTTESYNKKNKRHTRRSNKNNQTTRKEIDMSYLKEGDKLSSMRLMFVIGLIWSMIVSTGMTVWLDWGSGEFVAVFLATSGVFTGSKIAQKAMEKK